MLSKQQLLIPRVLCIGGKEGEPNDTSGDFITGDILTIAVKSIHRWMSEKLKQWVYLDPDCIEKYPHLFKPLPWWYGRTVDEMPKFAKHIKTGSVIDISDWYVSHLGCIAMRDDENNEVYPDSWNYEPADEAEYLKFNKYRKCPDCDSIWRGNERCPECNPMG